MFSVLRKKYFSLISFIIPVLLFTACKKDKKSSGKEILSFSFDMVDNPQLRTNLSTIIIEDTIYWGLPYDTMSKILTPNITISSGATILPVTNQAVDFSQPVAYTVKAEDGSKRRYVMKYDPTISASIISFSLAKMDNPELPLDVTGAIVGDTIYVRVPEGISTVFKPTIELYEGASYNTSVQEDMQDFSTLPTYTITGTNGSVKEYVVVVVVVPPPVLSSFKINGANCAYDSVAKTFYFPVNRQVPLSAIQVTFDTTHASMVKVGETITSYNTTTNISMAVNNSFTVSAVNEFGILGEEYKIIITGLPIVQITTDYTIGDDRVPAGFTLTDPDYREHGSNFLEISNSEIKLRGASSRQYPKKSYGVKLRTTSGSSNDVPLLGLRSDQNWILDAMYVDKARMRNRLCTDIWNSINNVPHIEAEPEALNGTRGYFVEVFINKEYRGLYCLTEKVDRKQLKAKKKSGYVYKANEWTYAVLFGAVMSDYDNTSTTWNGWEMEYPDGDDRTMDWAPLYDFVSFISTSSNEDFNANIANRVNIPNIADFLIFINIIGGDDNRGKNTFFSIYDITKSNQFFYTPWDMDGTMGRDWSGAYKQNNESFLGTNNALLVRLLNTNSHGFKEQVQARWNELKNNQLSKTSVAERMTAYKNLLLNTNAFTRESEKWPEYNLKLETEVAYMIDWYNNHYAFLDAYLNNNLQ
jgi:hypothetical protein